jgi:hypothetical protein
MVRIYDQATGKVAMLVENLTINHLTTTRAVAELVAELRYDLRTCVTPFGSQPSSVTLPNGA